MTTQQPIVIHNKPELFGWTEQDSAKARMRYWRSHVYRLEKYADWYQYKANTSPQPESDLWKQMYMNALVWREKREKNIAYLKKLIKMYNDVDKDIPERERPKSVDLQQLRETPLKELFERYGLREDQHKRGWYSCPLHSERSSSFHIMPNSNRYKCFGCGATGSPIDFIMAVDKISVAEAIKKLSLMVY